MNAAIQRDILLVFQCADRTGTAAGPQMGSDQALS